MIILMLLFGNLHKYLFKCTMRDAPIFDCLLKGKFIKTWGFFIFEHLYQVQKTIKLCHSNDHIPTFWINFDSIREQFLNCSEDLFGFWIINVKGNSVAIAVFSFQIKWSSDAFETSFNHNCQSVCQDVCLFHRMGG